MVRPGGKTSATTKPGRRLVIHTKPDRDVTSCLQAARSRFRQRREFGCCGQDGVRHGVHEQHAATPICRRALAPSWRQREADLCARQEYMVVANVSANAEDKQRDVVREAELVFQRSSRRLGDEFLSEDNETLRYLEGFVSADTARDLMSFGDISEERSNVETAAPKKKKKQATTSASGSDTDASGLSDLDSLFDMSSSGLDDLLSLSGSELDAMLGSLRGSSLDDLLLSSSDSDSGSASSSLESTNAPKKKKKKVTPMTASSESSEPGTDMSSSVSSDSSSDSDLADLFSSSDLDDLLSSNSASSALKSSDDGSGLSDLLSSSSDDGNSESGSSTKTKKSASNGNENIESCTGGWWGHMKSWWKNTFGGGDNSACSLGSA
ncbi:hypothetical protein F443_02767 [Phytophthora nicotianae P1569]|uniref:Uncharacterized protein n=2 Tax=Phytophthora nicotianae TaxID=4792 RepID=V9FSD9_PHYNI|nr:hypothetical protein F443_02767 [Phytophthora nicotianae P1569]